MVCKKSKALAEGCEDVNAVIWLNNQSLEKVESFAYLGRSIDKSGKASTEVVTHIEKGGAEHIKCGKVFQSANLSKATKMKVFELWSCSYHCTGQRDMTITQKDSRKAENIPHELPS